MSPVQAVDDCGIIIRDNFVTVTPPWGVVDPKFTAPDNPSAAEVRPNIGRTDNFPLLAPPTAIALRAQKAFTFVKGKEVFQDPLKLDRWNGDQRIRDRLWIPALKRVGVRYRNPYQTRHTFASVALMAGEHVMWVAKQLGHVDWSFTARTYARWIPDDMPTAGDKAAKSWGGTSQLSHSAS